MNIKKEVGEKIKRLRKQRGITQENLAEIIDISPRNLSNIEQGISFPKSDTFEKIVSALNTTTEEMFANDSIKTNDELKAQIYFYTDLIKDNNQKLELAYKLLKNIAELF
jgi:transcriptional regulator with XRE-family HTH domain